MSVLKYFKTTPVAPHRATGPKYNFFLQICNEVPDKKNARGPVPPQWATGSLPPYITHGRHSLVI